ncbi:hypothetical protein [Chitinolyticbacter albus]|uniref:hypothetical protein n=1 Tax=Chitinolyticbacter albus TaxID=2961951 RepID=UPI00210DC76E|nr:hypothetical protein [Chitinolyticbacter albus]
MPKPHPVLESPHLYVLVDLRYHVDLFEPNDSYLDLRLERVGYEPVALRFWRPVNLQIESGFPYSTGGMVFYDLSADGLEHIGVEVADFEGGAGAITFMAKSVERIHWQA